MSRPRLLDLFCGAGGAGRGYAAAGFEVVGVDFVPQPEYPFEFHRRDALGFPMEGFDVVHASPPCQAWTASTGISKSQRPIALFDPHVDLIGPTREKLETAGVPYVIENVPGAPLINPIRLCGTSFGLEVVRHRLFEFGGWWPTEEPPPCDRCRGAIADGRAISVYGHGGGRMDGRRGMRGRFDGMTVRESFQRALGLPGVHSIHQLSEAIPPAYTEWVGRALLGTLMTTP
jgi:hypothetical protein